MVTYAVVVFHKLVYVFLVRKGLQRDEASRLQQKHITH